jgi:hypothetical protein
MFEASVYEDFDVRGERNDTKKFSGHRRECSEHPLARQSVTKRRGNENGQGVHAGRPGEKPVFD